MSQTHIPRDAVEVFDYASIRDAFCDELTEASQGGDTSLPFIKNRLPHASLARPGDTFQVFVIGGTNGESATIRYGSHGALHITDYEAHPGLAKFTNAEDFLRFFDSHIKDGTKIIGLNFGFKLQPSIGSQGQLDGILVSNNTKGHAFEGLQRTHVGAAIEAHFQKTHIRDVTVTVGNDSVCLIASIAAPDVDRGSLVAGIVGTGYNMAFFSDAHTIVNTQATDFSGFTPSATGKIVDTQSTNVGEQLFNKEVAAGDLYKHYNLLAEQLTLDHRVTSAKELADIAITHTGNEGDVARALLQRSASLVAAQFAGFYNFKGRPPLLTAIMQGSLFWNGPNYKEMVTKEIEQLGVPSGAIVFEKLEHADIIGAAKLVTGGL